MTPGKPMLAEFASREAWLASVAADFRQWVTDALNRRPVAHIALSGGATPLPLYAHFAGLDLPWNRLHGWVGDERWLPADHAANNGRAICGALGSVAGIIHFHPWNTTLSPEQSAAEYEQRMRTEIGTPVVFDLVLLGLGTDGHTASLFPGSPALEEHTRDAAANRAPAPYPARLTLTYPALNRARAVWFLATGEEKKEISRRLQQRDRGLPAARVEAGVQKIYWAV